MNWIIYTAACLVLFGFMQFFIKLSSTGNNPVASSMIFVTAQFLVQIFLGAYFVSKGDLNMDFGSIKFGIAGGIVAAIGTILYFLALESGPLSKVVPVANMSLIVGVLLGVIFLREAMNIRIVAGIGFAIISIYLLTNGS
ncbi:MAG: EamA family transporter [Candidatus Methanoperedens sp.]|nr:EamA family transporter [Candidatus Methanoperedens sp.]MCZ7360515.1 EamA family transporter [Candidatus Methanoperedens sp.]HLB71337.1 EamA family transporter [Candidatus Methanoperedens sp.]